MVDLLNHKIELLERMHWTERVREKCRELRLSDARIAEKTGLSKTTLSNLLTRKRDARLEQKIAIADVLGVSPHWLETGEDAIEPQSLPYVSLDEVNAFFEEEQRQATQRDSGIRIIKSDGRSFLVRMDNDSMIDPGNGEKIAIPNGSTVQIDRDQEPVPGKIILIEYETEMLLRVWQRLGPKNHIFKVINPHYMDALNIVYKDDMMKIFKGIAVGVSYPL